MYSHSVHHRVHRHVPNNQTPRLVSALVHARGARRCNGHVPHLRHSHRTDASQLLARGFALSLDKQRRFQLHAGEHLEAFPAIGHEGRDLLTHKGVSTGAHNTVTDVRRHRTSATTAPPEAAEGHTSRTLVPREVPEGKQYACLWSLVSCLLFYCSSTG